MLRIISNPPTQFVKKNFSTILISVIASIIFLALNTVKLEKQGIYYDEVFQATASFAYVGKPPFQFSVLVFRGIPLMNMNYIGAIKTGIYGLYLRISDGVFSVTSWRLVGILCVTVALMVFGIIIGRKLHALSLLIFYFLFITDITVALTSRFDWGPVALGISIRLIMIAVWVCDELSEQSHPKNSFIIAILFGIAVFEKLSAITLFIPILVMMFSNDRRRTLQNLGTFVLGGLIGFIPILLVNLYSYYQNRYFISLQNQAVFFTKERNVQDFLSFGERYLSLANGREVGNFILGVSQDANRFELIGILFVSIVVILVSWFKPRKNNFRLSVIMLLLYFVIGISVYLLPARTWVHHWIIGTPFQYMAISLAINELHKNDVNKTRGYYNLILGLCLSLLLILRLPGIIFLEQAYLRGVSSSTWNPSFTRIGEFAAEKSETAIFITGDWGIANQLICFTNGQPGVVHQVIWNVQNINQIVSIVNDVNEKKTKDVYFVFTDPLKFIKSEDRDLILFQIEKQLLADRWLRAELDSNIVDLSGLTIYRFQKRKK